MSATAWAKYAAAVAAAIRERSARAASIHRAAARELRAVELRYNYEMSVAKELLVAALADEVSQPCGCGVANDHEHN